MSRLLTNIAGFVHCMWYDILSMFNFAYYGMAVHTFSFVDAVKLTKHLGMFRTKRKSVTLFRRA